MAIEQSPCITLSWLMHQIVAEDYYFKLMTILILTTNTILEKNPFKVDQFSHFSIFVWNQMAVVYTHHLPERKYGYFCDLQVLPNHLVYHMPMMSK